MATTAETAGNPQREVITGLTSGDTPPEYVTVRLPDGTEEKRAYQVHPLAQLIPLITGPDLDRLTDDIAANGVNEPLWLFEGRILDGRNRLAVASVTGAPIEVREFEGDHAAAKAYVWSANAARRHLTIPQLALAAARFGFIEEAKQAARTTYPPAPGQNGSVKAPRRSWSAIASKRMGGAISPRTLERFDEAGVTSAPQTVARIDSGKLRRMDVVVKEAAAERSLAEGHPVEVPPPVARTPWDRLGCARGDVLAAERSMRAGEPGAMTREQFTSRAREIQGALIRIQALYREQGTR